MSFCSQKSGKTYVGVLDSMREGDRWTHSTFRYSLAKNLCDYLTAEDITIRAIYIFGSTMKNEASYCSDIDLIFHVSKKTGKLEGILKDIDSRISRHYSTMMGNVARGMEEGLLDFKIVDDKEVKKKEGFASVITSIYEPPFKIWG